LKSPDVLDVITAFAKHNGYERPKNKFGLQHWLGHEDFHQAIVRAWESVTSDTQYLQNLYQIMPGKLQQCIATDGDIVD
jgi:hypothetical protein